MNRSMITQVARGVRRRAVRRAGRVAPSASIALGGVVLASLALGPASAAAAPPQRTYEIVSPYQKGGADVGVQPFGAPGALYSGAAADGNRMMFGAPSAPVGDAFRGVQFYATATRTTDGWKTVSTIPGPQPGLRTDLAGGLPNAGVVLSDDATALQFMTGVPFVNDPLLPPIFDGGSSAGLYLGRSTDTTLQWLTKPVDASATPKPGEYSLGGATPATQMYPAGGSTDFRTSYFAFCGTLTAQDAPRIGRTNYGFYVTRDGVTSTAGILPDGTVDPDGAEPAGDIQPGCTAAAFTTPPVQEAHQVSNDGTRAFFVSPAPIGAYGAPVGRPTQLFVHRTGQASLLLSRSLADPAVGTPDGVLSVAERTYAFATPDGAHVVFASPDRLTAEAPSGASSSRYRADIDGDTVALTYLPDVNGTILGVSDDAQRILYLDGDHLALDDHGTTRTLSSTLSGGVQAVRRSTDGGTWVFSTTSPIGDAPTHSPGTSEIYRYVIGDDAPTCVSCVGPAAPPATGALLDPWSPPGSGMDWGGGKPRRGARVVSSDGTRVYFDTPDALLPTDTNGMRDVYGWEDGTLSLISPGTSLRNSFLLDTSASGDDVFFASAADLVAGDQDGNYDVYDARIGGGFAEAPTAAEACLGDACQGPAGQRPIVAVPGSTTAGGSGNVTPPKASAKKPKKSAKAKLVSRRGSKGRVVLRLRVPGTGRIVASGSGLRTTRRTAKRATTYTLTVRLAAGARRSLKRHGKRRSKVRVVFTPRSGDGSATTITVSLTVRK